MSQGCYSRLEIKTLIRGHARRPDGVTRNAPTPSTAVYPSPSAMLALESCSACFSIEHRVVVNRMLRHGLDDIPVFCDLSAFHSKQVDGGITSQTRTPDAVYVQDDKFPVRIDPQDLAAGLRMG